MDERNVRIYRPGIILWHMLGLHRDTHTHADDQLLLALLILDKVTHTNEGREKGNNIFTHGRHEQKLECDADRESL